MLCQQACSLSLVRVDAPRRREWSLRLEQHNFLPARRLLRLPVLSLSLPFSHLVPAAYLFLGSAAQVHSRKADDQRILQLRIAGSGGMVELEACHIHSPPAMLNFKDWIDGWQLG